jgi:hypothetical protein
MACGLRLSLAPTAAAGVTGVSKPFGSRYWFLGPGDAFDGEDRGTDEAELDFDTGVGPCATFNMLWMDGRGALLDVNMSSPSPGLVAEEDIDDLCSLFLLESSSFSRPLNPPDNDLDGPGDL